MCLFFLHLHLLISLLLHFIIFFLVFTKLDTFLLMSLPPLFLHLHSFIGILYIHTPSYTYFVYTLIHAFVSTFIVFHGEMHEKL